MAGRERGFGRGRVEGRRRGGCGGGGGGGASAREAAWVGVEEWVCCVGLGRRGGEAGRVGQGSGHHKRAVGIGPSLSDRNH